MYRAYEMKLLANNKKLKIIDSILIEYRKTASSIFNLYWSNFVSTGKIPQFIELSSIKSSLSERYKQTCASQVRGILMSYISNRANDFKEIIYKSSIKDEELRIKLLFINKHHKFFDDTILMKKKEIEPEIIKLARKIFHHLLKVNRLPKMSGISMALDEKVAVVSESNNKSLVSYWIRLSTIEPRKPIMLPVSKNRYYEAVKATRANFIQLNKDRDGYISVSFIKDVAPKQVTFKTDRVSIDLGLTNLLTFNDGSMYGRTYLSSRLKDYDKKISTLCARLQRNGVRPRSSRRYRKLVDSLRAFLKNEINRVMNKSLNRFMPKHIVVERLNFQSQRLSKRLNRLIGNFGKSIVRAKLNDFSEKYGTTIEEVNPAYTSQTCSSCDYVAKKNRRSQSVFICACCGLKLHADINAARCIDARSSSSIANIYKSKAFILDKLVTRFIERQASHYSLAKITQCNPYFGPYSDQIALVTRLSNINGVV
jgi:transposon, transposase